MPGNFFSFEDQIVFYGQYHRDSVNKAIHFVFVPVILWSVLVLLHNTPAAAEWAYSYYIPLNIASLTTLVYTGFYILIEPLTGILYAPFLILGYHTAHLFASLVDNSTALAVLSIVVSFAIQIAGHEYAEKRRPAFFDNLSQAFLFAPFFVFFEILTLFGYKKALCEKLDKKIDIAILKWKAEQHRAD
ncbi:uncharacterized protein BJ171DRAFT_105292 [Polychytrium aggregatum]|uniref:uncharacterized protein n=1 Tax=Polychytrium aggregatum TaxID=110093 RepID=UPI0022FEAE9B|nr:uncharacterized protein BJ171DRAFT_105292 [Polychytrium aggregatum]KAI9204341.1 hypothetical protein BJ171DRAFT_105292 [Polychytrium aggregatum]